MKKNVLTLTIAFIAILFISSNLTAQEYVVDAKNSNVHWLGKKVTGEHAGTVGLKNGNLSKRRKGMVGNFVIDLNQMTCTDLEGEYGEKLVGHLQSPDFFDVANHPTANFTINRLAENVDRKLGTNYTVYGILTIKGISQPINFPASILIEDQTLTASGKIIVNRTDFEVKYGSGKFFKGLGDKMIYDDFELDINLVAYEATTRALKKKRMKTNRKINTTKSSY